MDFRRDCLGIGMPDIPGCPATSGGFQPDDVSGLSLWHDAGYGITITGSGVSNWEDRSANGWDSTQDTDADRPTNPSGILNGYPVVRMDGTNHFLDASDSVRPTISTGTSWTMFFVIRGITLDGNFRTIMSSSTGNNERIWFGQASGVIRFRTYTGANTDISTNAAISINTGYLLTITHAPPTTLKIYLNNVLQSGVSTGTSNGTINTYFGIRNDEGAATLWAGDYAEILLYNSVLSDTDRGSVSDWLISKYNL